MIQKISLKYCLLIALTSLTFLSWANQPNPNCEFCKIISKKAYAQIIDETDDILVIEKRPVRKPVNCLILPKKHIVTRVR